jgi:hypothetical protein
VAGLSTAHGSPPRNPALTIVVRPPLAVIIWLAPRPTIELSEEAFAGLLAHPEFDPDFSIISDWRRATADAGPYFDRDFLAALGRLQSAGSLRGRWATVVPPSVQMVGLYRAGRTIEILGRTVGLRYEVFVSYDDAVAWASDRWQETLTHDAC